MEYITKHNEEEAQGKHTFKLAVNQFADLTHAEWQQKFTPRNTVRDSPPFKIMSKANLGRPDSVDWRDEVSDTM